jgi:hypothetical protein
MTAWTLYKLAFAYCLLPSSWAKLYAFNLYKDDIDQGELCDVHYWQERALKAEGKLKEQNNG